MTGDMKDAMKYLVPDDLAESFRIFVEGEHFDATSLWSIVNHYRSTLALEPREILIRLHYADMLNDLSGTFDRVAAHVGISHPPDLMAQLVDAASFDSMKANADRFAPAAGQRFWRNDAGFFDSGGSTSGRASCRKRNWPPMTRGYPLC